MGTLSKKVAVVCTDMLISSYYKRIIDFRVNKPFEYFFIILLKYPVLVPNMFIYTVCYRTGSGVRAAGQCEPQTTAGQHKPQTNPPGQSEVFSKH